MVINVRVNFLKPIPAEALEEVGMYGKGDTMYFEPYNTDHWFFMCQDWAKKNLMNIANIKFFTNRGVPVEYKTYGRYHVKNGLLGARLENDRFEKEKDASDSDRRNG